MTKSEEAQPPSPAFLFTRPRAMHRSFTIRFYGESH
jgi:hypothetical protein